MTFSEYLNDCMTRADCNARELSEASGLSQAVISRYRAGDRVPALGSDQLARIIHALVHLSNEKYLAKTEIDPDASGEVSSLRSSDSVPFSEAELTEGFSAILHNEPGSVYLVPDNLNAILISADVNIKRLSEYINYDPSYISRIRSGQRRPSNPLSFAEGVSQYLLENCDRKRLCEIASQLYGCSATELDSDESIKMVLESLLIRHWEVDSQHSQMEEGDSSQAISFVRKLSEFDLDEYIRAIHFDKLHVPTAPIQLPTTKTYYSIEELKQGELDFFRQTVLSRSKEPIYMCSDMDMADMAEDLEFGKKWMFAIAAAIKKGLKLNIIHSLDRPFNEMMLGLESWIPLYMTGQVTSYYLTGSRDKVYSHLHYVSGAAALTGECIRGHHTASRYYLTNNKKEISYYHTYCGHLFGRAKSLMLVFTRQNADRYAGFLSSSSTMPGPRRLVLSAPPLASMPHKLLEKIIARTGVKELAESIRSGVASERRLLTSIMRHDPCEIELSSISREEFMEHPVALSLSGVFADRTLTYTWEEYQEHLSATRIFAEKYPLCTLKVTDRPGFRNIRIHILKGRWVMVSKNVSPAIHFVIRHPRLRSALENMVLPVLEDENDQS